MQIVVDPVLKPEDLAAIRDGLHAYNDAQVASAEGDDGHIGILLKDEAGKTIGGLTGRWYYDWLFVELLYVPEALRGQDVGTRLMGEAEAYARGKGMTGVWLDTFDFQARGFYEKLGYAVFGELPNYPGKHSRFFLSKRIQQE
ncbi:MAG: GNAT family N-acetyltransferase [Devosia sp.]